MPNFKPKNRRRGGNRTNNPSNPVIQAVVETGPYDGNDWSGRAIKNDARYYVPITRLGSGSYASVWMCYSTHHKMLMAIKIFKKTEKKSGQKEIETYRKFSAMGVKNIVKMHDSFDNYGNICIVFDLMIGSLYDIMKKARITDLQTDLQTGLPLNLVTQILHQILGCLDDFHRNGITHGDIKPENILINGRTVKHLKLVENLKSKDSIKRIVEFIKNFCSKEKKLKRELDPDYKSSEDSDYGSDSNSDSSEESEESDSDDSDEDTTNDEGDDKAPDETSGMSDDADPISISDSGDEDIEDSDVDLEEYAIDDDNDDNNDDNLEGNIINEIPTVLESEKLEETELKRKKIDIDAKYFIDTDVRVSDLGSCVAIDSDKKPRSIQTKYYRSPEVILGCDYSTATDIWALGCTIYELLTGEIMFDPDPYEADHKRTIMQLIYTQIGEVPEHIYKNSPLFDVFFTESGVLKADLYYDEEDCWKTLLDGIKAGKSLYNKRTSLQNSTVEPSSTQNNIPTSSKSSKKKKKKQNNNTPITSNIPPSNNEPPKTDDVIDEKLTDLVFAIKKAMMIDMITRMVHTDPTQRITAEDALNHPLFSI